MLLTKNALLSKSILSDVKILAVDNDRDSGSLYTTLFEQYGGVVTTTTSVEEALHLLNQFVPDIVISEAIFLGESIDLLIQKVEQLALHHHKSIPIVVTSTYSARNIPLSIKDRIDAYQLKPIDITHFVDEVWKLRLLSKIINPFSFQD